MQWIFLNKDGQSDKQKNAPGTEENCPNAFSEVPATTSGGLP